MSGFDSLWQRSTSGRRGTAEAGTRTGRLRGRRRLLVLAVAMIVAAVVVAVALAAEYDLSTQSPVTINNGIFEQFNTTDPTGSGTFESFVRISSNALVERGYNTSHRPLQFDENSSPTFTHDEPLSHVPIVVRNGVLYREFQADLNQNNVVNQTFITLDNLEVYLSNTSGGSLSDYPFTDLSGPPAELVYTMDGGASNQDNVIRVDANASGSGKRDMRVLIPESNFANSTTGDCAYGVASCNINVTLFSQFGGDTYQGVQYGNNDGYEEWGVAVYTATKSGVKYNDLNHNGVRDAGEPGLPGWRIYVDINGNGSYDVGEPTAVTDATGAYSIGPIPPGEFKVREVQQNGWTCSQPATSDNFGCYYDETFGTSGDHTGNNFGNFQQPGTKSGVKFNDLNGNGVKDAGEPGLQNWVIKAYVDANGDGIPDSTTPAATKTTDANGAYSFSLAPGKYVFCEAKQSTWTQSRPFSGMTPPTGETVTTHCADLDSNNAANGYAVEITSGSSFPNDDFGNFQQGTKSGEKFNDLNANGSKDAGDPGLPGWTIRAYKDDNGDGTLQAGETTIAASTTTDASGNYSFSLDPGTYVVCEVAQATWTQSKPSNDLCSAIAAGEGVADGGYAVTITSGSTETGNDFGNWQQGTKSGTKFNDLNGNGVKDAGEPGLPGWTIRAYKDDNGDGTLQAGETTIAATSVTDATGAYLLTLDPGNYVVCEVMQSGWQQTAPNNTKCSAIAGLAPGGFAITVTSGSSESGNNFGNNVPFQGCTPGFWQGGLGKTLWNTTNDPQWTSHGGAGTNPFLTTDKFDSFFTPYKGSQGSTQNKTMYQFVSSGGGPKPAEKAARMVVAAYLNAAFGLKFPYTTTQIKQMWTDAVNLGTAAAFTDVFNKLGAANENPICPIS